MPSWSADNQGTLVDAFYERPAMLQLVREVRVVICWLLAAALVRWLRRYVPAAPP